MRLIVPLSLTSVDLFPVPITLTVVPSRGHTAAGGTAVRRANGAGFNHQPTVRRTVTATLMNLVPARVAEARRSPTLRR